MKDLWNIGMKQFSKESELRGLETGTRLLCLLSPYLVTYFHSGHPLSSLSFVEITIAVDVSEVNVQVPLYYTEENKTMILNSPSVYVTKVNNGIINRTITPFFIL